MKPSIGRIVHYVMPDGQHRPAIVLRVWNDQGCCNLQVFPDGTNDAVVPDVAGVEGWATSVMPGQPIEPGTWHWPEREEP